MHKKRSAPITLEDQSQVVKDCYRDSISLAEKKIKNIKDLQYSEIYKLARVNFSLERFLDDMIFFGNDGYPHLVPRMKKAIPEIGKFKQINNSFTQALKPKTKGPKLVRFLDNFYIFYNGNYYERSELTSSYYQVLESELFVLLPRRVKRVSDKKLFEVLDKFWARKKGALPSKHNYWYFEFLEDFKKKQASNLNMKMLITRQETTCRRYTNQVESWTKRELTKKLPISFLDLNKITDNEVTRIRKQYNHRFTPQLSKYLDDFAENIEKIFKIHYSTLNFVNFLKQKKDYKRVYLFRDAMSMYETEFLFSLLTGEKCSSDYFFLKRKMLSKRINDEHFFGILAELLYQALEKVRDKFDYNQYLREFYKIFVQRTDNDPEFRAVVKQIFCLLKKEGVIKVSKTGKIIPPKLLFIDTGLRGTIPLMMMGTINYFVQKQGDKLNSGLKLDMALYLVGPWLEKVFKERYYSLDYSFMRDIEHLRRSEHLYDYIPRTFMDQNGPKVEMGTLENQVIANLELITLGQICHYYIKI